MKLFLIVYRNNIAPYCFEKMVLIAETESKIKKWLKENIQDIKVEYILPINDSVMTTILLPRSIDGKHYKFHMTYTLEEDGDDIYTKLKRNGCNEVK